MSACCNSCVVGKPCESGCPVHPEDEKRREKEAKKRKKELRKLRNKLLQ